MKKSILSIITLATCTFAIGAGVNTFHIHKSDGSVVELESSAIDSMVTSRSGGALTHTIYRGGERTQFAVSDLDSVKFIPYTLADTWTAYDAFHNTCFDSSTRLYKQTTNTKSAIDRWNGCAAIWCQPMFLDMAINAYLRAKKEGDTTRANDYNILANRIYMSNRTHYVMFNFDDNNTNTGWFIYDDIQWWTITLARYYKECGLKGALTYAQNAFARVWYGSPKVGDTGSYASKAKGMSGGMFWQWQPIEGPNANVDGDARMSCINWPTVIAAVNLYEATDESVTADPNPETWTNDYGSFTRPHYETKAQYLAMAKEIYEFAAKYLWSPSLGKVYDSCRGLPGTPSRDQTTHIYNQATMIGASVKLYKATGEKTYLDNANKAADYVFRIMSTARQNYMLPWESGIEQGIYTTILAQYMHELIYDCGQTKYLPNIRANIVSGWSNRDTSRNICGGEYWKQTTVGADIDTYSASGIPALMLLFPPE